MAKKKFWQIVCFHETNFRRLEGKYLKEVFAGDVFHAPASVKKRGILIGIVRSLQWQETDWYVEPEGQFLIIKGSKPGKIWALVRDLCPTGKGKTFF